MDNASIAGRPTPEADAASSADEPIYTPLHSPDGSLYLNDSDLTTPATAAAAYFESRSVQTASTDTLLVHEISVTEHTLPIHLEFPEPEKKWLERDVLPQDWETFINYLIPHHADVSNHEVADRKLKAELIDERMSRLTLDENARSRTDLQDVDAQLEPLRQSHTEEAGGNHINSMISLWNEGFFGPRGAFIDLVEPKPGEETTRAMPGAWTNDPADQDPSGQSSATPCGSRRGRGGWIRADDTGFHIGRNLVSADKNGFRVGRNGLVADNNGFRIGNMLVADGQGFKLGPIRAGSDGLRFGGRGRGSHSHQEHHRRFRPDHHNVEMPEMHRGRHRNQRLSIGHGHRDRSSSTSSSSSSSSSTSIESAGSLPDYDHLDVSQLPIARESIKQWLAHPEQPITKEAVKQITREIKAAKGAQKGASDQDLKALRQEVRELFKDFKAAKKAQRNQLKAAKHTRRIQRREAKRARKAARRAEKAALRAAKKEEKEIEKQNKRIIREGKQKEDISPGTMPLPPFPTTSAVPGLHTPPGAWPSDHGVPWHQPPPHYTNPGSFSPPMPSMPPMPPMPPGPQLGSPTASVGPPMVPPVIGRGWPFTNSSRSVDTTKAAELQAEGRRIEAEAALRSAEKSRQNADAEASNARERAEKIRQKALADAGVALEKAEQVRLNAQANAARLREQALAGAEAQRQKALAKASIARKKAEAARVQADAVRMQADVNRMRTQAGRMEADDKARLKLLDVAEQLEEEAEKLRREGERLMAEAVQSAEDLKRGIPEQESEAM